MRHAFNTFLSTSASASASVLPSLNAFSFFHPCLQSLTRIQTTIIQRVPRRHYLIPHKEIVWEFRLNNIRPELRYARIREC